MKEEVRQAGASNPRARKFKQIKEESELETAILW